MIPTITPEKARILEDAVTRILNLRGGPGIRVTNSAAGITVSLQPGRDAIPLAATATSFLARITAVSGSFPTWSYTAQRVTGYDPTQTGAARALTDGHDITSVINGFELVANSPTYTHATGVSITNTDGTVNSGSCKIQSIGVGAVVPLYPLSNTSSTTTYMFCMANSAQ